MTLIFKKSLTETVNKSLLLSALDIDAAIPEKYLRKGTLKLPRVPELEVVRHYTGLSQQNFSVDTNFYPLGSCTMKYNPHVLQHAASLPGFAQHHPESHEKFSQGLLECLYELSDWLKIITGMEGVSLTPMAGAQGELTGCLMIRAYHRANNDFARTEIIIPDAAHGTNPASAMMAGFKVCEVPTMEDGDVNIAELQKMVGPKTAGIMLTNPSTLGVFERKITEIAKIVHDAGGLLYYDGANLNAILGKVRPGDMGFDVIHLNLHKTFATPHGGGGPGAGPVAVSKRLVPFLPVPLVHKAENGYVWLKEKDCPQSIGRLAGFFGNVGVLLQAYAYLLLVGKENLARVAEFSALNANYLRKILSQAGFNIAYPERMASHEFLVTLKEEARKYGIAAKDFAKRLLDFGFHAPTTYFPLLVPECLLIEPTETESKKTLDNFAEIMKKILEEAASDPELLHSSPHVLHLGRLDDVKAARELDVKYVEVF